MERVRCFFYAVALACSVVFACGCGNQNSPVAAESDSISSKLLANSTNAFFSMPSPLETALLLKDLGVKVETKELHSLRRAKDYLESKQRALNLGVYAVDFCFASIHDQSQLTLNYADVINTMLKQLGIVTDLGKQQIDSLQLNISNKTYVKAFISEHVLRHIADLSDERKVLGGYTALGGFVEGLYLLLSSASKQVVLTQEFKQAVADQRLILDNISAFVAQLDKAEISQVSDELSRLKSTFDKIKSPNPSAVQVYDSVRKVSVVRSKDQEDVLEISKPVLNELLKTVKVIRASITK